MALNHQECNRSLVDFLERWQVNNSNLLCLEIGPLLPLLLFLLLFFRAFDHNIITTCIRDNISSQTCIPHHKINFRATTKLMVIRDNYSICIRDNHVVAICFTWIIVHSTKDGFFGGVAFSASTALSSFSFLVVSISFNLTSNFFVPLFSLLFLILSSIVVNISILHITY